MCALPAKRATAAEHGRVRDRPNRCKRERSLSRYSARLTHSPEARDFYSFVTLSAPRAVSVYNHTFVYNHSRHIHGVMTDESSRHNHVHRSYSVPPLQVQPSSSFDRENASNNPTLLRVNLTLTLTLVITTSHAALWPHCRSQRAQRSTAQEPRTTHIVTTIESSGSKISQLG